MEPIQESAKEALGDEQDSKAVICIKINTLIYVYLDSRLLEDNEGLVSM